MINRFISSLLLILSLSTLGISQSAKLTELPVVTPSCTDLVYGVHDPSGSPASNAFTVCSLGVIPFNLSGSNTNAFSVGPTGTTNTTLSVATNTSSGVTGLRIINAAAGSGVTITSTSSNSNESILVSPKGTGQLYVNSGLVLNSSAGIGSLANTGTGDFYISNYGGGSTRTLMQVSGVNRAYFGTDAGSTFYVKDETATTGGTTVIIDAGAGQGARDITEWRSNTSTVLSGIKPTGGFYAPTYETATNCADGAGAAACGSAAAGSFVIDVAATTVVVSTTAVTANSEIFIIEDSSLGTRLGSITCNTTPQLDTISARTTGTSFTVTTAVAPIANPRCYSYHIVN